MCYIYEDPKAFPAQLALASIINLKSLLVVVLLVAQQTTTKKNNNNNNGLLTSFINFDVVLLGGAKDFLRIKDFIL